MSEHQTILITGAASGLGRAWAEGFSADGATVIAVDINREGLDEVPAAFHLQVDVGNAAEVKQMIVDAVKLTGRIDVLFNNAGMGFNKRLENSAEGAPVASNYQGSCFARANFILQISIQLVGQ